MVILEHGQEQERTLSFFPCTAEPVWAFAETIALLSKTWHVLQAVFDGHQLGVSGGLYLRGASRGRGRNGLSEKPRRSPGWTRPMAARLAARACPASWRLGKSRSPARPLTAGLPRINFRIWCEDSFWRAMRWRLSSWREAEKFWRRPFHRSASPFPDTIPSEESRRDGAVSVKTYSDRTIRSIFWSGNNYALPDKPAASGTKLAYWYGEEEKKDRKNNIRFLTRYFPQIELREFPNMAHAELMIIHPEEFCRYAEEFLTGKTEGEEDK